MSVERVARNRATRFREEHELGNAPLGDLFELGLTTLGIDVFSRAVAEEEHGLTISGRDGRKAIIVAATPHYMRQRSNIAHEFGHLLADDLQTPDRIQPGVRTRAETQADAFARHLLLPIAAVSGEGVPTTRELSDLVQRFEVSPRMAAIQLCEAKQIDEATKKEWSTYSARTLATRFGWLDRYNELSATSKLERAPQRLVARAIEGYLAGALSIHEVAQWYGKPATEIIGEVGEPASDPDADDPWEPAAPPPKRDTSV
nr:ImmA/IrrE family metallo-endopeptidase [Actinomycetales bacterium]